MSKPDQPLGLASNEGLGVLVRNAKGGLYGVRKLRRVGDMARPAERNDAHRVRALRQSKLPTA